MEEITLSWGAHSAQLISNSFSYRYLNSPGVTLYYDSRLLWREYFWLFFFLSLSLFTFLLLVVFEFFLPVLCASHTEHVRLLLCWDVGDIPQHQCGELVCSASGHGMSFSYLSTAAAESQWDLEMITDFRKGVWGPLGASFEPQVLNSNWFCLFPCLQPRSTVVLCFCSFAPDRCVLQCHFI